MDELFSLFMGKDHLSYEFTEDLCCIVTEDGDERLEYDDTCWENVCKQKMVERKWLDNETPRSRKTIKKGIAKKSRRKLFKTRKGKKKRSHASVTSPCSSGSTRTEKSSPVPCTRKRKKLRSKNTHVAPKRKVPSATSDSNTNSQESRIPTTRRCLFKFKGRKRKQASSLETSSRKCKPSATPSSLLSSTLLATSPPPSDSCGLESLKPLVTTPPAASANGLQSSTPLVTSPPPPLPSTIPPSCLADSPSSCDVFSASCPREQLLTCNLPPVECSVTVRQTVLVRVPVNFIFTDVATLEKRPPTCVVTQAVALMTQEKRADNAASNTVNLEEEDNTIGVSIGNLGVFSRAGLGQLEWLGEVALMRYNVQEEKRWVMETPDNLDDRTRNNIMNLLNKFPLNHLVTKEGKYSVDVRAFSKLALERYIDDTIIDTAIARMQRQYNSNESALCLPAHTITWLDTGDKSFIRQCFRERLQNVDPGSLKLVLVPVNMDDVHWGLMVIDITSKIAYFDDGLMWACPSISYVHLILRELSTKFPDCANFSSKEWLEVKTFKRFGMPRQPTDGKIIGSGSCGIGVILSAQDFIRSNQPESVSLSWSFDQMTVHRKEIMKLLSSA